MGARVGSFRTLDLGPISQPTDVFVCVSLHVYAYKGLNSGTCTCKASVLLLS